MDKVLNIAKKFINDPDGIYKYIGELEDGKHFVFYMFSDDTSTDDGKYLPVGTSQYLVIDGEECRYADEEESQIATKKSIGLLANDDSDINITPLYIGVNGYKRFDFDKVVGLNGNCKNNIPWNCTGYTYGINIWLAEENYHNSPYVFRRLSADLYGLKLTVEEARELFKTNIGTENALFNILNHGFEKADKEIIIVCKNNDDVTEADALYLQIGSEAEIIDEKTFNACYRATYYGGSSISERDLCITLYRDENPGSEREIRFYIEGKTVRFEQQDIGKLVDEYYCDSDYEWVIWDLSVKELCKAMEVSNVEELIHKMKNEYNTVDAWDRFSGFCYDKKLQYKIWIG